jgi:hypothetical protein
MPVVLLREWILTRDNLRQLVLLRELHGMVHSQNVNKTYCVRSMALQRFMTASHQKKTAYLLVLAHLQHPLLRGQSLPSLLRQGKYTLVIHYGSHAEIQWRLLRDKPNEDT